VIGVLSDANPTDDIEVEKLQLGQLMSRITNVLSLQCITDELVTQVLLPINSFFLNFEFGR